MHLDEQELDLLARFFAKRFPHAEDRASILKRAQLADAQEATPRDAWRQILVQAQAIEALPDLGRAVTTTDPEDANLREVRRLLIGAPKGPSMALLGGLAFGSVAIAAVGLFAMGVALRADRAEAAREQLLAAAAVPPAPTLVAAVPADEPKPARGTSELEAPEAPLAPRPSPALVVAAPERHITADHCLRRKDAVGYWYAGSQVTVQAGDLLVVPHDVYVRVAPPSLSNDWNTRTQVECVLYEGDVIRLATAPIAVPPDVYWVRVSGADLVAAGGQAL